MSPIIPGNKNPSLGFKYFKNTPFSWVRTIIQFKIIHSFRFDKTQWKQISYFLSFVLNFYLFGVLRGFQHCTGHITMGSWKGRGNQYIEFTRVPYCKLPTNGKQLPAFPHRALTGIEPRPQRWEARVLPLCHRGPSFVLKTQYIVLHARLNSHRFYLINFLFISPNTIRHHHKQSHRYNKTHFIRQRHSNVCVKYNPFSLRNKYAH